MGLQKFATGHLLATELADACPEPADTDRVPLEPQHEHGDHRCVTLGRCEHQASKEASATTST